MSETEVQYTVNENTALPESTELIPLVNSAESEMVSGVSHFPDQDLKANVADPILALPDDLNQNVSDKSLQVSGEEMMVPQEARADTLDALVTVAYSGPSLDLNSPDDNLSNLANALSGK